MHLQRRADPIPLPPYPTIVNASGTFDGNDGRWSSFVINVNSDKNGLNGQNFKVLISTSSPVTLVPAQNNDCDESCAAKRGVLPYMGKAQKGLVTDNNPNWIEYGLYDVPLPYWFTSDLVSQSPNGTWPLRATWGTSNVGLGESTKNSPVIAGRYIAKYTFGDFFMGSFGLGDGQIGEDGTTKSTFLTQYEAASQVASSSYGYTAGAYYRNMNGVTGSLVLGGYDKSRMADRNVSVPISTTNTTLAMGVQSITYAPDQNVDPTTSSFTAQTGGFSANIDSTLPYLILPEAICNEFQDKFQLQYNEDQNLYFVNSSAHNQNKQLNAKVTFKIGPGFRNSDNSTNIELPYAAFDQQIGSEIGDNFTNYFPIKRSTNGINTLGRTFLQEAYIIVDYERSSFTVAQAYFSDPMPKADIKTILNTTYVPPDSTASNNGGGMLAPGAIAGTVVGIVVAFAIAGILAFCWWRKRKTKKEAAQKSYETQQIDPTLAGQEVKYRRVSELTGSDLPHSPKTPLAGYYSADHKSVPPISEMSPDSPPVELYSPPPESASDVDGGRDYFTAGKPNRRGAQRDRASSGRNTPGTPIAELPGDDAQFYTPGVSPLNSPLHSRGPSDTSLSTNIDERLADHKKGATTSRPTHPAETAAADEPIGPKDETQTRPTTETTAEQRPSHQRGLSDTTIASDSTAVSQPTPEEQARWASEPASGGRPLSQ